MEDNNNTNAKFLEWLRKNCPNLFTKALLDHQFLNGGINSLTPNITGSRLNHTNIFSTGSAIISTNHQHQPLSSESSSNTIIIDDDHLSSSLPGSTGSLVSSPFPMHRKKFDPNFATSDMNLIIGGGGDSSGSNDFQTEDPILTMLATTVTPRNIVNSDGDQPPLSQEHIIQSHSESNRNAFIYVAVILSIYLFAVACIAIQFYRKHQTLDPFSAYMLGRNKKTKNSKDQHHYQHHSRNQRKKQQQQQHAQTSSASISPQLPSSSPVKQHNNNNNNKISPSTSLYLHAPEPPSITSSNNKEKTTSIINKPKVKNFDNNVNKNGDVTTAADDDASKINWLMRDKQNQNHDHHLYHHHHQQQQKQCQITNHEQQQTVIGNGQKQQPQLQMSTCNSDNNDGDCGGLNLIQSNQTRLTSENFMDAYCSTSTSITIDPINDNKNSSIQYYNFNSSCHESEESIQSSKIESDNTTKKMIMLTSNSNNNNKVENQILIDIDVTNNNQNSNNKSQLMEKNRKKLSTKSDLKKKSKNYYSGSQEGCKKSILDNESIFEVNDYEDGDDDDDEPETEEDDDEDLEEEDDDDEDEEEDHEIDDEYDTSSVTLTPGSTISRPKITQIPTAIRLKNFFSFGSYSSQASSSPTPPPSSDPLSQVSSIKENNTPTTGIGITKPKFKLLMRSISLRTSFDSSSTTTNSSINTATSPNQLQSSSEHHSETQTPSSIQTKVVRFQRRSSSSVIHSPCGSQIISTAASSSSVSGSVGGGTRYEETHL